MTPPTPDELRRSTCSACNSPTLEANGFVLEPFPILPRGKCEYCKGTGQVHFHEALTSQGKRTTHGIGDLYGKVKSATVSGICADCNGTGKRGEPPAKGHILLNAKTGEAKPYEGGRRKSWQALHRRHHCETSAR